MHLTASAPSSTENSAPSSTPPSAGTSTGASPQASTGASTHPTSPKASPSAPETPSAPPSDRVRPTGRRDTDGMAVASFVLGLLGLLVLNIVLGPIAVVLASVALWRGTARRGRALLGLGLGVADLVVLVTLMSLDDTVSWSLAL